MSGTTSLLMQSSSQVGIPAALLVRDVWDGLWAHPWLGVLIALLVVRASVRSARNLVHSGHARDAVRTFSRADKITILTRAGGRCEHHSWLGGR